jgi:hypothetical protein
MGSFFVPSVGFVTVCGHTIQLKNQTVFDDVLPLNACLVVGPNSIVCGGDNKKVTVLKLSQDGPAKVVFVVENERKIAKLALLNKDEVLVVDSSGAVKVLRIDGRDGLRELFAHFSPVTAVLVLGDVLVTADVDAQVRVCNVAKPREITHYLLGNSSPVLGLYRGEHDQQLVCVTRDKVTKYFDLSSGSNLEIDPFTNSGKQIQSTKSRKTTKKPKTTTEAVE